MFFQVLQICKHTQTNIYTVEALVSDHLGNRLACIASVSVWFREQREIFGFAAREMTACFDNGANLERHELLTNFGVNILKDTNRYDHYS